MRPLLLLLLVGCTGADIYALEWERAGEHLPDSECGPDPTYFVGYTEMTLSDDLVMTFRGPDCEDAVVSCHYDDEDDRTCGALFLEPLFCEPLRACGGAELALRRALICPQVMPVGDGTFVTDEDVLLGGYQWRDGDRLPFYAFTATLMGDDR